MAMILGRNAEESVGVALRAPSLWVGHALFKPRHRLNEVLRQTKNRWHHRGRGSLGDGRAFAEHPV